jgi:hypothetical protein
MVCNTASKPAAVVDVRNHTSLGDGQNKELKGISQLMKHTVGHDETFF